MLLFFAGTEGKGFIDVVRRNGGENMLNSFYSLGCGKHPPIAPDYAKTYVLDSGGFAARVHGIDIDVKVYADYLNKHNIKFAFNLDVLDLETSMNNFYYLMEHTNTYIMPVYHGPEWADPKTRGLIDYYVDCFPFIALGGIAGREVSKENVRRFLSYVFNRTKDKVMVHGLGTTQIGLLEKYPFFCVDSTSWLTMTKFATSVVYSDKMAKVRARNFKAMDNLDEDVNGGLKRRTELHDFGRVGALNGAIWIMMTS